MSKKVAELRALLQSEDEASWVVNLWDKYYGQMATKRAEWSELRNYLFATDTSTTSNSTLPWKNSTTLPKLAHVRDNLHSNYISSLFPNEDWLRWEGYSQESTTQQKAQTIQAYMKNKTRECNLRNTVSRLLYDYIDTGNCFTMPIYEERYKEGPNGDKVPAYIGPNAVRISPLDIVFNPTAESFDKTFKIVRSIKSLGEIAELARAEPDNAAWALTVSRRSELRRLAGSFSKEDFDKAVAYSSDGFGSIYEYYMGDTVEILEFWGDAFNSETGLLEENIVITIVDRSFVARHEAIPGWYGGTPILHVGWRLRPDNLWAMGPLDNLVGMQYRIDHLENLKADAQDLIVQPPLKIIGNVEEFVWEPGAEIHIDEGGDVVPLTGSFAGIVNATNDIQMLEARMEQYAGAPREAMGIRTPGEKTAFEIQRLELAAGRIFQEKVSNFEINCLEPLLNWMLEMSVRNFDKAEVIKVLDEKLAISEFLTVTKEDIVANGVLRPIGARHFSARAQLLQNLTGVFAGPLAKYLEPNTSAKELTKLVEDTLGLDRFKIFQPNIAVFERAETQRTINAVSEETELQSITPIEGA